MTYDIAILGGGIVGLATARALHERSPGLRLIVLEKESDVGTHQTAHNSGVIHSGIYYRPGSLKARLCVAGARQLREFCDTHRIPYRMTGKVIVATTPPQLAGLERLAAQGRANGVAGVRIIGPEELHELEPHARGAGALHVGSAGVVRFPDVARQVGRLLERDGVDVRTGAGVLRMGRREQSWRLETTAGDLAANFLVTCGGLHADRLASMAGCPAGVRIVPFRGEFYDVVGSGAELVRSMIYPMPDPAVPFLGVHLTRDADGQVHAGPNAVLAFKREGYQRSDWDARDLLDLALFPGFWRMAAAHWRFGRTEWLRSRSVRAFLRDLRRLVPEFQASHLAPGGAGVRAQAVDRQGRLVDDFVFMPGRQALHVLNVPSPAATAALAIGARIAGQIERIAPEFHAKKTLAVV